MINLTKTYCALLEIDHLGEHDKRTSLMRVFTRDIQDCSNLKFNNKQIRPVKGEENELATVFKHLTTESKTVVDDNNRKYKKRVFEADRSKRLHWVKYHIDLSKKDNVEIFSCEERVDGKDVIRTYIYDKDQQYTVVLEPQKSGTDYYLITAYHLNRLEGIKSMEKRWKRRLKELY